MGFNAACLADVLEAVRVVVKPAVAEWGDASVLQPIASHNVYEPNAPGSILHPRMADGPSNHLPT